LYYGALIVNAGIASTRCAIAIIIDVAAGATLHLSSALKVNAENTSIYCDDAIIIVVAAGSTLHGVNVTNISHTISTRSRILNLTVVIKVARQPTVVLNPP
jgi:hypothetical protein